jgi:uncharacterized membrane protein YeaQ/YmgE (transglycosylase-associated protein family)
MLAVFIVIGLITGAIAGVIRQNQGSDFWGGFAWGALLGIIGIVVVLATKPKVAGTTPAVPVGAGQPAIASAPPAVAASVRTPVSHSRAGSETKVCPDCAEPVQAAARKCRYCGWQFQDERLSA